MHLKKKLFYTIFILTILINTTVFFILFPKPDTSNEDLKMETVEKSENPKPSAQYTLNYGDSCYICSAGEIDDHIEWEFSGSNQYVGLCAYAMNDEEYTEFASTRDLGGTYELRNDFISASGSWNVPYEDKWYFVIYHQDETHEATVVTYDAGFYSTPVGGGGTGDDDTSSSTSTDDTNSPSSIKSSEMNSLFTFLFIIFMIIIAVAFTYGAYHYLKNAKTPQELHNRWQDVQGGYNNLGNTISSGLSGDYGGASNSLGEFQGNAENVFRGNIEDEYG
ncbi:MAG: hypothetical protein GF383_15215, partial [Candidatus Lokiarchaeota archaeon]|nr:hypothetical protein [Candidatus Lokiarchaeota archaeon]MBD3342869.1 hypothetical protein [Candidatus Lokiarchaeota archaeon]